MGVQSHSMSYKETPFSSPLLDLVYDGLVDSLEA
jgi:hypothetical protein